MIGWKIWPVFKNSCFLWALVARCFTYSISNYNIFDRYLHKIYPDSLIAKRSGNDCSVDVYLDVLVRDGQNGFSTSVYHKVDDFSFPVILDTFPGDNVPFKMGDNVFSSEYLR